MLGAQLKYACQRSRDVVRARYAHAGAFQFEAA
jgi:hypothetical protein